VLLKVHCHDLSYPGRESRGALEVELASGATPLHAVAIYFRIDPNDYLGEQLMSAKRDAYVEKMKKQLDELNAQADELEKKMQHTEKDVQAKLQQQLEGVREKRDQLMNKLEEMKTAGEDLWEKLVGEVEHAWEAFKHSVNYFKSYFK
jgi:DNA anti-recombination protein RmuC